MSHKVVLIGGPKDGAEYSVHRRSFVAQGFKLKVSNGFKPDTLVDWSIAPKMSVLLYEARIERGKFVYIDGKLLLDYVGES